MDLVVLPSQTLFPSQHVCCSLYLSHAYLCDAQCPPFLLPEQLQCASRAVEVVLWDSLQHLLRQLHMAVFVCVVRVSVFAVNKENALTASCVDNPPRRVMDRVDKFIQLFLLVVRERARLLVSAREVDIQFARHGARRVV